MSNKMRLRPLVFCATALILPVSWSQRSHAQTVRIDSSTSKRVLARADLAFRSSPNRRAGLDALGDSLVAIAVQPLGPTERTLGDANSAILRLGIAGSDPAIDYRGAVPRLLKIALESPSAEVARRAVSSLRSMTDTVAAVTALERLSTHPSHAFNASSSCTTPARTQENPRFAHSMQTEARFPIPSFATIWLNLC
jgi:hypothetical protein